MRFAFFLIATVVCGQDYDLGALQWRNIGPNRGGRSQAIAGSARQPLEYYFGATGGGLWKTTNGGVTWFPVTDGQIHSSSVGAVAVAESNPDVVYLGMGETELRGNIMQGDGVYKSADAGKTWKHVGLGDTQAIARIRVDPSNPEVVYVAALGHPYARNTERGVFRSTDGGANWKRVLYRDDHAGAVDLSMDSANPRVLYASLWDAYRTPWTLSSGGPSSGLFKSIDGGDHWTEITRNAGMPKGIIGKITIAVSPADSRCVYALVEADDGGLFQSNDAGATWTLVNADRSIRQRAFYFSRIAADPKRRDTVYALNVEIYRSDDGGKTLRLLHTPHSDHHDLWIASDDPQRIAASDDGGGSVSTDGGKTWTPQNYPTAQMYHAATTAEFPYDVCGAQQDDGTVCVGSGRALNLRGFYPAGGGEAGYVAPDPKDPNIFYSGDQAGIVTRYDRRTGQTRSINVYPLFFSGMPASALKERWQWTFPIVFSPVDPKILYTSSQHLFRTVTQGQRWETISPDLTRNDPATLGDSGGPITKDQNGPEIYGTIFSIAPSRHDANTVWTGSDDGLVYVTRDGGKHWSNVTPPGMGEFNRVSMIEASPNDPAGAYMAAKRYQMDDRAPYLYRTHDFGKSWQQASSGIPEGSFLNCVREDPLRKGLLYACTEKGVYVSFDEGDSWQSLQLNMPTTSVRDLVVHGDDLVIATHGRSFWILDDAAPLREMGAQVSAADLWLFKPSTAYRVRSGSDQGTPVPLDEALAENPPDGAVIDYWLKQKAKGPVELEIFDSEGAVVRRFSSADLLPKADPNKVPIAMEWIRNEALLSAEAGMHRFVWDLHYAMPKGVRRSPYGPAGVWTLPGKYTVKLAANLKSTSQTLTVKMDPRISTGDDALRGEFVAASRVSARLGDVAAARERAEELQKEIAARATEARANAEVSAALAELGRKVGEVHGAPGEEEFGFFGLSLPDGEPATLHRATAALTGLLMIIDGADAAPTPDAQAAAEKWEAAGADALARWKAIEADVVAVNAALEKAKLKPLPK